ncbi:MAG: CYTH domain-containing protein [Pseudomonadales bacterium]
MAIEIERKFLVSGTAFLDGLTGTEFQQGYLSHGTATVRVRIAGEQAFLTIKGKTQGISRSEYEYAIPKADARNMLATLCDEAAIEKTRYLIEHAEKCWEVDVFHGANQGLIVAEIELKDEHEKLTLPDWVAEEVSSEVRYFNSQLAKHPYSQWSENGDNK